MSEQFEKAVANFVERVKACEDGARRTDLQSADRKEDLVRQTARKRGLVEYADRGRGLRWHALSGEPDP